jgi:uncharacterized protein YcbK (DUF882 family)
MRTFFCASLIAFVLALTNCNPLREDEFAQWLAVNNNRQATAALTEYLKTNGVGDVVAIDQLLRSDTQWRRCHSHPFAIPPKDKWPEIIPTLHLIRDEVKPLIGPVEAMSVFRSPGINLCIKGASLSYHLQFRAIDLRPAKSVSRDELIEKLCALHARNGRALNMGLGIYRGTRFHIDTAGYRRWGHDHHAISSPCASFVAPQRKKR